MSIEALVQKRRREILTAKDEMAITGQRHYVANDGDDFADGRTPQTAWRTLEKVSAATLQRGDAVLFRRGDLFRGHVSVKDGVTYAAYGEGEKPRLYGSECDLADPMLWKVADAEHHIWKCTLTLLDSGTLVFNHGEAHSRKLIPSYIGGRFVSRDAIDKAFVMADEMTRDLDMVCLFDKELTTTPSKGEDFPIPCTKNGCPGDLYLRCDHGNPGEVFRSIESLAARNMMHVGEASDVRIDNLCFKYIGRHAISAGGSCVKNLYVSNCEIGWIGGCIQHYFGTDPNYPQGTRGTVTHYGNGIEIYGGCDGYEVNGCYIYQVYDAGITHQISCFGTPYCLENVHYHHNLIEYCVYSIEYFLETTPDDTESIMRHIEMNDNILRLSGYGWGQQRHNTDTPAHIKGWNYVNPAENYSIHDNVFDRAAYRMLHLVAYKESSLPQMANNTYIQYEGNILGQYGANAMTEPPIMLFDPSVQQVISTQLHDTDSRIFVAEE